MTANLQFTRRHILLLGSTAVVGSWAQLIDKESKFWDTKDPLDWSADEIDRLVTKSPWAKAIKASVAQPDFDGGSSRRSGDMGGGNGGSRPGGLSIPGLGGGRMGGINIPGIGSGGGGGRGGGQGRGSVSKVELIVRWDSAKPVLDALRTPLAAVLADHYVVSLNGVPNMYLRDQASERPDGEQGRAERSRFQARLTIKGKSSVRQAVVQQAPGALTQTFLFGFPTKELAFSPDDEVTFATQLNHTPIAATFNLREMTYRGALAI